MKSKLIELSTEKSSVKRIIHISDIHIRNYKRHAEYRSVFKNLKNYVKSQDDGKTICVLTGDIAHSKIDISPEYVNLTQNFLNSLANIMPTLIMLGNHDANLSNENRLDAITPIRNALSNKNLHFMNKTALYRYDNIVFSLLDVRDSRHTFIKAKDIPDEYIKIALFHGIISNSSTDVGHVFTKGKIRTAAFNDFDMVLLGDIHKYQVLQEYSAEDSKPRIAYAGSLIQQDFGESPSKGLALWDVEKRVSEFVEVKNDYGYYTLFIKDNELETAIDNLSAKPRIRLKIKNSDTKSINKIIQAIKKDHKVQEVYQQKLNYGMKASEYLANKINFGNIRDVNYQNELILKFLEENTEDLISEDIKQEIVAINVRLNSELKQDTALRSIVWKPIRFEYDNMFTFGKGNVLEFSEMSGLFGIFASNHMGKSSILDALLFNIFDKCSRTTKAVHVLNNKCNYFTSKFEFELNDTRYFIERNGNRDKYGHVKVDSHFYYYDKQNKKQSLNGLDRNGTNANIRLYMGNYEDLVLTNVSTQDNNSSFIDISQRERNMVFLQFLDLGIFEKLHYNGNEKHKEVKGVLKKFSSLDLENKLNEAKKTKTKEEKKCKNLLVERDRYIGIKEKYANKIIELSSKMINTDIENIDLDTLTSETEVLTEEKLNLVEEKKDFTKQISELKKQIKNLKNKYLGVDVVELDEKVNEHSNEQTSLEEVKRSKELLEIEIKNIEEKIEKLGTLEYDENCSYCMNNVFVKDAIESKSKLTEKLSDIGSKDKEIKQIESNMTLLSTFVLKSNKIKEDNSSMEKKQIELGSLLSQRIAKEKQISITTSSILENEKSIKKYNKNLKIVKLNSLISKRLKELNEKLSEYTIKHNDKNEEYMISYGNLQVDIKTVENIKKQLEEYYSLEKEFKALEYYITAIKRSGVPYMIITEVVPKLEAEVNNILSQIVDYSIILETDNKNINGYIVYDEKNFWPLELGSGMEKFITSIAIRAAFINISNLPRPNMMAIDEGFGVLDRDNINNINVLLDYLKYQFEFVLVISHLDVVRDMVDNLIDVSREKGFSYVNYS